MNVESTTLPASPVTIPVSANIAPGTYTGIINVTNNNGCSSSGNTFTFTINALPSPSLTGPAAVCAGSTGNLYYSDPGMTNYNWTVSSGGKITAGGGQSNSSVTVTWITSNNNTVKVNYINTNGCTANTQTSVQVTVNPLPTVKITNLSNAYSLHSSPVLLQATPSGGIFSDSQGGIVLSGGKYYFDPSYAGVTKSDTVVYYYTNPSTACSNNDTVFVTIEDSDAFISGLRTQLTYCNFDKPFLITGANVFGNIGSFSITGGIGLKDNGNNTATIYPSEIQAGIYTITYTYYNNVTYLSISQNITLDKINAASISGLEPGTYCNNSQMIQIYGNYSAGIFTGNGIIMENNLTYFDPPQTNPGKLAIYFKYTTSYGCSTSDSLKVTIAAVPKAKFTVINNCLNGDSTIFINNSEPIDSISSCQWNFGDNLSGSNNSDLFNPKHIYSSSGTYKISLIAENILSCTDTTTQKIYLGNVPEAGFSWDKNCYSNNILVDFNNQSSSSDPVSNYNWSIFDSIHQKTYNYNSLNISHTFSSAGNYNITLKLTTTYGCKDSLTQTFHLQPVFTLRDSSYFSNFENSNSYWYSNQQTQNNWYWGNPDGKVINSAYSGNKAIYTSFTAPHQNQQFVINGPCFDFSNFQRPYIDMWVNYNAQSNTEGAVLQYSRYGTGPWNTVGNIGTGIKWYNSSAIASMPGNQSSGWTGNSSGWIDSRNKLDSLIDLGTVQLRMVYGSSASAQGDGFAFDNVSINQRSKSVLYEQFTNLSDIFSNEANNQLDSVVRLDSVDACIIQYHTSFPGTDSLNSENKADPGARVEYYGIGSVPVCYLDGSANIYDFVSSKPNINDLNITSLANSLFDINLSVDGSNGIIQGNVNISSANNLTSQNISLFIAVVEDIQVQSEHNFIAFNNVLRKFISSNIGNPLQADWSQNQITSIPYSWTPGTAFKISNLKIIAFIQDQYTREVYQAVELPVAPYDGINTPLYEENNLSVKLYPNPVSNIATIAFSSAIPNNNYKIQLTDIQGKEVKAFNLAEGTSLVEIDVTYLPDGLYIIKIFNINQMPIILKMMAIHL